MPPCCLPCGLLIEHFLSKVLTSIMLILYLSTRPHLETSFVLFEIINHSTFTYIYPTSCSLKVWRAWTGPVLPSLILWPKHGPWCAGTSKQRCKGSTSTRQPSEPLLVPGPSSLAWTSSREKEGQPWRSCRTGTGGSGERRGRGGGRERSDTDTMG